MAFSGWPEEALDFYDGLAVDNTKTYWTARKAVYTDKILRPMTDLTEELAAEFGEPKIFRPYRDVRFSADKPRTRPISERSSAAPATSSCPPKAGRGRRDVGDESRAPRPLPRGRRRRPPGPELEEIVAELEKADITVHGHGALKSAPRGYPADHPRITLLRYKGLTAWKQWPVEPWLESATAKDLVVSFFRTAQPLCSWLSDGRREGARAGSPG